MRLAQRTRLTLLTAALLLAAIAGTAAANTLDMNEQTFRSSWRELTFSAGEFSVSCPVTLEGTFTPGSFGTIAKTAGNTMARVTRTGFGTCTGGTARALAETLPWSVKYSSFAGTLPNITGVTAHLIGASFLVNPRGLEMNCLGRTEESHPIDLAFERNASSEITGARLNEALTIPLTGGGFCGLFSGSVSGRASVTDAGSSRVLKLFLEGPPPVLVGPPERTRLEDLSIREPVRIGQIFVVNTDQIDEARLIIVTKEGTSPALFRLLGGVAEDCSFPTQRLRPRQESSCTVRVEYLGTPAQRPAEMTVRVEYLLGNNLAPDIQRFRVTAN
jgi:hypothetical protein